MEAHKGALWLSVRVRLAGLGGGRAETTSPNQNPLQKPQPFSFCKELPNPLFVPVL